MFFVIESPVGVGYSYCSAQVDGKVCARHRQVYCSTARAAVVDFFRTKFPELASNEFFITGESYAGVYIPTLTKEILDNAPNLVGITVGFLVQIIKLNLIPWTACGTRTSMAWRCSDAEYDLLWDSTASSHRFNLIAGWQVCGQGVRTRQAWHTYLRSLSHSV